MCSLGILSVFPSREIGKKNRVPGAADGYSSWTAVAAEASRQDRNQTALKPIPGYGWLSYFEIVREVNAVQDQESGWVGGR